MKRLLSALTLVLAFGAFGATATENWKGKPPPGQWMLGGTLGPAIYGSDVRMSFLGSAAVLIKEQGLLDDVNDQLWFEGQAGMIFLPGSNPLRFNAHLRWDFHKDLDVTLFATGGVGMILSGVGVDKLGITRSYDFLINPRFGLGMFWHIFSPLSMRLELTHDYLGAGLAMTF